MLLAVGGELQKVSHRERERQEQKMHGSLHSRINLALKASSLSSFVLAS